MQDETRPEPVENYGNTIDGTRVGDGSDARTDDAADTGAATGGTADEDAHAEERARQKGVYRAPDQPDHALGGTEDTTDGA
ncbi:MAG TPA: hypothetical protein GX694_11680 [Actinomycetales bacterium]|nr:hypothetical protein [Actinomycetales bacterium]